MLCRSTYCFLLALILFFVVMPSVGSSAPKEALPAAAAADAVLAITDVSVLPLDREIVLEHQTVLVFGGSIAEVGPARETEVPEGATVIDGSGRYLIPGLADMHAHLRRKEGQRPQDYLRQGITAVRNMAGEASHLEFKNQVLSGEFAGPLLFTTGQPLTSSDFFRSHRQVTTAEEGRTAVREQVAEGYDYVKVYSMLSLEAFDGIVEQARELDIPVVGHVSDRVPLRHAFDVGLSSLEHLFGYFWVLESEDSSVLGKWVPRRLFHAIEIDAEKLAPWARATAEAGVWNCPTLWRKSNYLTSPMAKEAWETPELRKLAEQNRRELVVALHDAGAGLLAGTDDRAEILHDELALFVEAGLTPYEALRTATVNAGQYLGVDGLGTVAVGAPANLVLLRADPLVSIENTRRIVGVVMAGTWIPR